MWCILNTVTLCTVCRLQETEPKSNVVSYKLSVASMSTNLIIRGHQRIARRHGDSISMSSGWIQAWRQNIVEAYILSKFVVVQDWEQ